MNSIQNNIKELYFTEEDISERWQNIKDDFWGDLKTETLKSVKKLLETTMDIEVQDLAGAKRWEHSVNRVNYRNGSYYRNLWTAYGWINSIKVPRVREGSIKFRAFDKYKQRVVEINSLISDMFLCGVSTRKVKEVLKSLYGPYCVSASTVSNIAKGLDISVGKYHGRAIVDDYVYLILDGIYIKVKSPIHSKQRCILVAYGIKKDGRRELIDFRLAKKGESELAWSNFLQSLYNRGLKGENLKLICIDGNEGLATSLNLIYPDILIQRCWAHKLRNVCDYLPKRLEKGCLMEARNIYDSENIEEARKAYKEWSNNWRYISPKAVECIERDLEELLNFYKCPKSMRKKIRTTNSIERVFKEVRRRTRPMSCFTNKASVERIIFAIFNRQNNIWKEIPLKEITQNS
jgi:transposase-like protein